MKFLFKLLFSLNLLLSVDSGIAAVKASINQTSVFQGDPVTLTVQSDQNNNVQPDLSPLLSNFDLQGTNTSVQINMINGNRSFKKTWTIELQPKLTGDVKIPAITIGNDKTEPINLTISNLPPEIAAETSKHIFIESSVEIENAETYVQQQIPYTVKLFYDSAMQTGEVFSPKIENANIRALGNDKKYQVVRAGKKYVVIEKHFVISPEKSGSLHISPTIVKGRIALSGSDSPKLRQRMDDTDILNQFFNGFKKDPFFKSPFDELFSRRSIGPTRPFSVSSEAIDVNVLPVPESFKGSAWMPAEEVIMTDSWSVEPPELKVGEPVTRKLILQVKGLASSQIPEIKIPKPIGVKVYPEQAKTETPNDGSTVYGIQHIDISYIPDKQGKVTIPEIKVDWWDIKNKKQQIFTLPEWNLTVAAGAPGSNTSALKAEPVSVVNSEAEKSLSTRLQADPTYWGWEIVATVSLIILTLLVLLYQLGRRFKKRPMEQKDETIALQLVDIEAVKASLLQACKTHDKHTATRLLLKLAKTQWNDPTIHNLGILASRLSTDNKIIIELERSLYAADADKWNGEALYKLVEHGFYKRQVQQIPKQNGLTPLYPV